MPTSYQDFLRARTQSRGGDGFKPSFLADGMFDFQIALTQWAVEQGRAAIFADCGLGKSLMQLVWAQNVVEKTNSRVLVLTPLAVSSQTIREGEKFGIECMRSSDGKDLPRAGIVVTNYERLHYFSPDDFAGVVCDESSILKSFNSATRGKLTVFMRKVRFRLLCTATAAPNDYTELGTSSEALGYLGHMDMLSRFFKNNLNNSTGTGRAYRSAPKWRFRGHAEEPFWRWVCSWARAVRKPSDIGFEDDRFVLSPLVTNEHVVAAKSLPDGFLFPVPASNLAEQREERKRTVGERCQKVAELVDHDAPALVWCHLNVEGDELARIIPDAVQVSGSDSDDAKEEKLLGFANGDIRVLVTKPKIGAWGLNFQHCSHVTFFPSHSFEQYYQGVRRCWRFGQENGVRVDLVTTEGEVGVLENMQRKARAADRMHARLVELMDQGLHFVRDDSYPEKEQVPTWL